MSSRSNRAILEFVAKVRRDPSLSVGPDLDRLQQIADEEGAQERYALSSPIANETWLQTLTLLAAASAGASNLNPMQIPYPCRIVGCDPQVLLLTAAQGIVEPPPEAILVFLNIDKHENLTMRVDKQPAATDQQYVCSLNALSSVIANRTYDLKFDSSDQQLNVQLYWDLTAAQIAAFGYGDVRVKLNWFVQPNRTMGQQR